jgi:hypothetical protein
MSSLVSLSPMNLEQQQGQFDCDSHSPLIRAARRLSVVFSGSIADNNQKNIAEGIITEVSHLSSQLVVISQQIEEGAHQILELNFEVQDLETNFKKMLENANELSSAAEILNQIHFAYEIHSVFLR